MQAPYNDSDALFAICRTDFAAYSRKAVEVLFPGRQYNDNWHVRAMAFELMRIREGKSTRLIINVPPRHFKSTIVSVLFVAFVLGIDPTRKIMVVSYAAELAIELQNLTRELMQSDFYRRLFPATRISKSKNTETYFRTSKSGGRFAVTPGGQATGFGADLIICDDILKPEDALSETKRKKANEYLQHTLLSRLEDKKVGAMILVQQRLHPEDTTGFALPTGRMDTPKAAGDRYVR